jgi:hypothetical protein
MSEHIRILLAVAATAVIVVGVLYGIGALNLHQPMGNALPGTPEPATAKENASNETSTSYIFIQEGSDGAFVPSLFGNYTLTLHNVTPYTFYISDRPVRDAGFVPMKSFLDTFQWGPENLPNAAIIIPDAKKQEDTLLVNLTNPVYVPEKEMLTYDAMILKSYQGKGLSHLKPMNDPAIQKSFGRVTVIIDSCPDFKFYCYDCKQDPAMACRYFMGGCGWVRVGTCWHKWTGCRPCNPKQIIDECNTNFNDCSISCQGETPGCGFCEPGFPV